MNKPLLALAPIGVLVCGYALYEAMTEMRAERDNDAAPVIPSAKPQLLPQAPPAIAATAVRSGGTQQPPAAAVLPRLLADAAGSDGGNPDRRPSPVKALHQRFEAETRDPGWSSNAEATLRTYLSSNADPTRVRIMQVQCAVSLCEIQATGLSARADINLDIESWAATVNGMSSESWWSQYGFDQANYMVASAADGRAAFVSYATRMR